MSREIEYARRHLKAAITRYTRAQQGVYGSERSKVLKRAAAKLDVAIDTYTRVCRLNAHKLPLLKAVRTAQGASSTRYSS